MTKLLGFKAIRVARQIHLFGLFVLILLTGFSVGGECPPGVALDEFCPPELLTPAGGVAYNHYNILFSWSHI